MSRSKSIASSAANSEADNKSLRKKSVAASGAPAHETLKENEEDDTDDFNGESSTPDCCPSFAD